MNLTPGQIIAMLTGGAALGNALSGGGGASPEQERLTGLQGDVAQINRDLLQSRAKNEQANMPGVMKTLFEAVSNQVSRPRSQILGPNFQPRLSGTRAAAMAPPTWTPYTGTDYGQPTPEQREVWNRRVDPFARRTPVGTPREGLEVPEVGPAEGYGYRWGTDGKLVRDANGDPVQIWLGVDAGADDGTEAGLRKIRK